MNSAVLDPESPTLGRSWRRSRLCGLDEGLVPALPYRGAAEGVSSFAAATAPVLGRLGDLLRGTESSAVVLDSSGCFLTSVCDDPGLRRRMDKGQSAPGFVWLEEYAGTSAVAIALEDRVPAWTTGSDHFLEMLRDLTCAAAPIIHPFTQRLEGAIDLTALKPRSSPLMMPIVLQAARAIEDALVELASPAERALMDGFLRAKRRPGSIVLAIGDRTEVTTSNATRLSAADRVFLTQRADDIASGDRFSDRMELSDGTAATISVEAIDAAGRRAGTIVEVVVHPQPPRGPRRSAPPEENPKRFDAGLVGGSQAARFLQTRVDQLAASSLPLMISGEPGVGKLALARAIAHDDYVMVDASGSGESTEEALVREVSALLDSENRTVLVRDIGALSPAAQIRLGESGIGAQARNSRLLCTALERDGMATSHTTFGVRIRIPALRERPQDVAELVPVVLERLGVRARISPQLMQMLMRYDWPGNIQELSRLLQTMSSEHPRDELTIADLPPHYQRGARRLRRIEHLERTAIVQALQEAHGNKTRAAELLEIGRATLYRKLRMYGLE